jgi:hypothetical protein
MTGVFTLLALSGSAPPADEQFFENRVRPVLAEKCHSCHGPLKQKGGLRLDSRAAVLAGGDSGPAAVPGKPKDSLLIAAVKQTGDLKMPPKEKLPDADVAALEKWIETGLAWPNDATARLPGAELWSLKPVTNPPVPALRDPFVRNPIDAFILAKLRDRGLSPARPADRRTLVRRATFDLTGLPPTPEEVEAFVNDRSPDAYEKLIDRLLASPAYGERWGRHWLDQVRYCDSFDARGIGGEMDCAEAWRYRDWVVKSLNADAPYDRFVRMQLAGDLLGKDDGGRMKDERKSGLSLIHPSSLTPHPFEDGIVATGVLAIGNWGGGDADKEKLLTDIADDQVDLVGRTFMGVTLACARCHDHKFDPFTTRDYYAVGGIFFSTHILPNVGPKTNGPPMLRIPLESTEPKAVTRTVLAKRVKDVAGKPGLFAWRNEPDCPNVVANATGAEAKFSTIQMPANTIALHPGPTSDVAAVWTSPVAGEVRLSGRLTDFDPNCGDGIAWELRHTPAAGDAKTLARGTVANGKSGDFGKPDAVAVTVAVGDRVELVINRNAEYTCDTTGVEFVVAGKDHTWDFAADWLANLPDGAAKSGAWSVEDLGGVKPYTGPMAHGAQEGGVPGSPHAGVHDVKVHVRGRYDRLGDVVPRGFPAAIKVANPPVIASGSGRKELADWLTRPDHPLTSRVIVNRVWQFHFGEGIVRTPSNFGTLGEPPTHPELLDHLATWFVQNGWSLKKLHKYVLLSATYQQSATADPATRTADPDNRLWGRSPRRRLEAEAIRDSLLAVSGELDLNARGGPATRDFNSPRRTLYQMTIRSDRTGFGPLFDAADPSGIVEKRTVSTVAPQALFLMNHPFVKARAKGFASRVLAKGGTDAEKLEFAHRIAFGRPPTADERQLGLDFLASGGSWEAWCHLLIQANEFITVE